jgi:hypothetical protein
VNQPDVNQPDTTQDRRKRRQLYGLAILFYAPLALSFYLYYGTGGWRPGGHVNHGDLVEPPKILPALALPLADAGTTKTDFLQHKWTFLYVGAGACLGDCRTRLYDTRQVRLALNRDMDRVQRVFMASGDSDLVMLRADHPDLITVRVTPAADPLLEVLSQAAGAPALTADRVYVIDPLGNLMMSYAPGSPPKGMLEDMKRLLGLSHVG